jgi:hypothetical protein
VCGGAKGGEGGGELEGLDSGVRFLALCRVMIGKILVTAKNSTGFPHVTDKSYDSMYSPAQEEYKLLNPGYVLPEFLVQYRFKGKEVDISAPPSGFDIDLSTNVVQLTKFDHKKEAAGTNLSQFPIGAGAGGDGMGGAKSQTAEGSEGGGAISITRCVSWTSPHRPTLHLLLSLTPPPPPPPTHAARNKATSASYTENSTWVAQRQNSAQQKATVIDAVQQLFRTCNRSYSAVKVSTLYQPRLADDAGTCS